MQMLMITYQQLSFMGAQGIGATQAHAYAYCCLNPLPYGALEWEAYRTNRGRNKP